MPERKDELPEQRWHVAVEDAEFVDGVRCVHMDCCGFTYDAIHTFGKGTHYTCPLCEPDDSDRLTAEVERLKAENHDLRVAHEVVTVQKDIVLARATSAFALQTAGQK